MFHGSFCFVSTVSDILREFNPNLKGFSLGDGDVNSEGANMNVAVAGAIAQWVYGSNLFCASILAVIIYVF